MSKQILDFEGFVLLRRGLTKHIRGGKLTPNALAVYVHLLLCADFTTGIQQNSAIHIVFAMGNTISDRHVRRALAHLEKGGYLKRFMIPGKRGDYPILIDKYEIRTRLVSEDGSDEGIEIKRLNAAATTDWKCPVYDDCAVDGSEDGSTSSRTLGRSQGRFVKKMSNNSDKNFGKNSGKEEGIPSHTNPFEDAGETPAPPIDKAVAQSDETVSFHQESLSSHQIVEPTTVAQANQSVSPYPILKPTIRSSAPFAAQEEFDLNIPIKLNPEDYE
jgi:hypothetical protein